MSSLVQPVEVHPTVLVGITGSGHIDIQGGGFTQHVGDTLSSIDGARLLCYASMLEAYFIQVTALPSERWKEGRLFKQSVPAYRQDVNQGAVHRHLSPTLKATKKVISNFLDIYLGCLAVTGGPFAYGITGMNLMVQAGKIKQNYSLYCDALEAFVSDNMELRRLMPTFHEHVYAELFLGRIEADLTGKARDFISGAIPAPKAVKGLIGVFLGKVGEDALKRTLTGIRDIIREVLLKVIDHVVTKNEKLSKDQIQKLATHHIVPMYAKLSRVPLRQDRAEAIVREAVDHAALVKPRLVKIAQAIDALE